MQPEAPVQKIDWSKLNSTQRVYIGAVIALLCALSWEFVLSPLLQLEQAIIYDRPVDIRLGALARSRAIVKYPELESLAMSLEPDDSAKGRAVLSDGTAHFFGPKINGCFQEKYQCRYQPNWPQSGLRKWFAFSPDSVLIQSCAPVN